MLHSAKRTRKSNPLKFANFMLKLLEKFFNFEKK